MAMSLLLVPWLAFAPARAEPDVLPLQRLRIYETGVAYFERHGKVSSSDPTALPVPAGHLDDALKTLVMIDGDAQAKIRSIAFASTVSEEMARAMAGLPEQPDTPLDFSTLLQSLEGLPVQIRLGKSLVEGRLIEVQGPFHPTPPLGADSSVKEAFAQTEPFHQLLLVDDDGAIRKLSSQEVTSIRPAQEGSRARLQVAAQTLSSQRAQARQSLSVSVEGRGEMGFGYIAEAPVWRTSYRVVLGTEGERGQLQGWALVHNDSDEDWEDVEVELANGRPASFLYPLAEPLYAERELVLPEGDLHSVPQLGGKVVGDMISEGYGAGGLGITGVGHGGGGTGEGTIGYGSAGRIGKRAAGGQVGFGVGDLAQLSKADGEETGVMFVYRCPEPLDLAAHHSALVPIVQDEVIAQPVTWFEPDEVTGQAGARVVNSTSQTWPAGTVSFFQSGGFVGETTLDRLKPRERRFLTFGEDLDLELERRSETLGFSPHDLRYVDGVLLEHLVERRELTVTLHNRSAQPRTAYVGLTLPRSASLEGGELDYDLKRQTPIVVVAAPPNDTAEQQLKAGVPTAVRHEAITPEALASIAEKKGWSDRIRGVLAKATAQAENSRQTAEQLEAVGRRRAQLDERIARLRSDLEALGKADSPRTATARISAKLVRAQEEVARLVQRTEALHEDLDRQSKALHEELSALSP